MAQRARVEFYMQMARASADAAIRNDRHLRLEIALEQTGVWYTAALAEMRWAEAISGDVDPGQMIDR